MVTAVADENNVLPINTGNVARKYTQLLGQRLECASTPYVGLITLHSQLIYSSPTPFFRGGRGNMTLEGRTQECGGGGGRGGGGGGGECL